MTLPDSPHLPQRYFPAVVIGAGPAGLSVSARLSRLGVAHVVLEQARLAESWATMPPGLHLVSPWWTNVLQWRDVFRHWPFSMVAAEDYAHYLRDFSQRHRVKVIEGCRVSRIFREPHDGRFRIETSLGSFTADAVVNATGYFSRPVGPEPPIPDDGSIPIMHAARYPGAAALKEICAGRTALVVGRRISAGQLMVDLSEGGVAVALSTRSPVEFRRDGFIGSAKDFIYYFYEELLLRLKPAIRAPSFPVMDGGRSRQLVESGVVQVFAQASRIESGTVHFEDGRQLRPGAIVLATGYRPCLPEMGDLRIAADEDGLPACDQWQASGVPGLYFVGLDNRMNYRSRTIRGIRSDSARVAARVKSQLG